MAEEATTARVEQLEAAMPPGWKPPDLAAVLAALDPNGEHHE